MPRSRLKKLREKGGISQKELGDVIGLHYSTIAKYESGDRTPNLVIAKRIADYFGVGIEYLFLKGDDEDRD